MARTHNKLSARSVTSAREAGLYADGGGLYLQVTGKGERVSKSWVYRFMLDGRAREMGLGSAELVTLSEARELVMAARKQRALGIDPIEARKEERARAKLGAAQAVTLREAVAAYIRAHKASWRQDPEAWERPLELYVYPAIGGDQPVQLIDASMVARVIEPLWSTKNETASRVRMRLEAVLDREIALGHRPEPNPARWKGNLREVLPARRCVHKVKHHAALPYAELPAFMTALRQRSSISAAALEFAILTCMRSEEVRGATWAEIDEQAKTWTVPAERMSRTGRASRQRTRMR